MSLKDTLTNEELNARFDNPFGLVNYAINLATIKVQRGEGMESNPANDVLELIADGRDHLVQEEIASEDEEDVGIILRKERAKEEKAKEELEEA